MAGNTNYTLYYNVLNYLKTVMKNHPSINYVTQGDVFSIDTVEFPQYPIGNVIITNATFDGKSTDYAVQIVVADKTKLKSNESSGSSNTQTIEFEGVDDVVDIHANTLSIINDILSFTDRKEEGFEVQGAVNCTAFKQRFDNGLAGWGADFTLRVHNDRNYCLFDLNPADDIDAYKVISTETSQSFYVTFRETINSGTGSFWTNEIEGDYKLYNISGSESIETQELQFENIDPTEFKNYVSPSYVTYKWFVDEDDANTNYTYTASPLIPSLYYYIDENGAYTSVSYGAGQEFCSKGVLNVNDPAFANNRTEGCD